MYVGVTIFALCGPVGVLVGFEATMFLSATGVGIFDRGRERHERSLQRVPFSLNLNDSCRFRNFPDFAG